MRHNSFADVTTGLPEYPNDLSWSGRVPARMDDNRTAQLSLSVSRGSQHLRFALRDGPAGANLTDHTATDVSAVGAVKHLADDNVSKLKVKKMRS